MSELREKDNYDITPNEKPRLCLNCFEFFGNQSQGWLCSTCYKMKSKSTQEPTVNNQKADVIIDKNKVIATSLANPKVEETKTEEKKVKIEPNKCQKCSKKVGLLGFKCSCELTFCKFHRLPEDHECQYDFTKVAREKLAKENPTIKSSKLERF